MPDSPAVPDQPRRRSRAARAVLVVLLPAALVYGGAVAWLVSQETRLVFQAGFPLGESRPMFPYEQVDLPRPDGERQFAWVMTRPGADAWVLFLHGNAATVASRVNIARYRELRAMGLNILAPEYRGFAGLPGVPTETGVASDARVAFDYLTATRQVPASRIVVYGWSLGSAVAVHLASQVEAGAVILEGAPASIAGLGQQLYPLFPVRYIMRNPFESIHRIHQIRAPLLFVHSPEDDVIPIAEGRRLYDAAPAPKRFVEVRGGHVHANDVDGAKFFGAIGAFLAELGLLERRH